MPTLTNITQCALVAAVLSLSIFSSASARSIDTGILPPCHRLMPGCFCIPNPIPDLCKSRDLIEITSIALGKSLCRPWAIAN